MRPASAVTSPSLLTPSSPLTSASAPTQTTDAAHLAAARARRSHRERRTILALLLGVFVVAALSLAIGAYSLSIPDLLRTLIGQGRAGESFVVFSLRLPRLALAALVGAAFALSGALFQTVLRNPLASPDIIGVTGGASAAAVFGLLVLGWGSLATSALAFGGGVIVAAAIYLLAWRGGVAGSRFVLIGVGVAFMVQGLLGYLLSRAQLRDAEGALTWLVGSVSGASWPQVAVVAGLLAVLLPGVWLLSGPLRGLQLGDSAAASLGVRVERSRLLILAVAVALAAIATAAVGPLAFVAFVAAPIARRMLGTSGLHLAAAALVGVLVTTLSDVVAQHLLPGDLPAGIVTGAIGAPYLLWLLATANSSGKDA